MPTVAYVARRSPQVAANVCAPLPTVQATVLAKTVNDRTMCSRKRIAHLLIDGWHLFVRVECASAAPVVLQIINSPLSIGVRVLCFVAVAAFIACARIWSGR